MYKKYIKRFLDIICAVIAIIALSPVMLITALLVKVKLGRPIFFIQERVGKNEKIFKLIKFRTMADKKDEKGNLLPDKERLTSFGKFLRSTSLDELPELFNVLKGDMSVVGPRPLLVRYLDRYTSKQRRRHEVRPGLSNISAVTGRNNQTWEEKFEKDVWYVDHISFLLDCKIIIKTIFVVFKREGITDSGGVSRTEFMGITETRKQEKV